MERPTSYMAIITSSAGILLLMPAKAISAATTADEAPTPFRFTQGTSTSPATGSHTNPSIFLSAIAIASADCCGVPPAISTTAAAAIPVADPTSAWQPPAAPAMKALFAITNPNAPAVNRNSSICSRVGFSFSLTANKTPGTTPAEALLLSPA